MNQDCGKYRHFVCRTVGRQMDWYNFQPPNHIWHVAFISINCSIEKEPFFEFAAIAYTRISYVHSFNAPLWSWCYKIKKLIVSAGIDYLFLYTFLGSSYLFKLVDFVKRSWKIFRFKWNSSQYFLISQWDHVDLPTLYMMMKLF